MDMTGYIPQAPDINAEVGELLAGKSMVACLEHMKWLGAFICIDAVNRSLIGAATTEEEAFGLIQRQPPDFLVASQRLEAGSGLSLVARTEQLAPGIKSILIIDQIDRTLIERALAQGCDGICLKSEPFMRVLRVVAGDGVYYPEPVADVMRQRRGIAMVEPLTSREIDVLKGLAMGCTDQQIARMLMISSETARTHMKHLFQKLDVSNRTQAAVKAIALGLVRIS